MSNDEFPPPRPSDGSETGLGDLAAGLGDGAVPPPPSVDSTQVMPVTPSLPVASPGGAPPPPDGAPPAAPGAPGSPMVPTEQLPEPPWFKQPGNLVTVVVGVLLVGGVIALLFLLRSGDDEGLSELSPEPVSFVLVRTNAAGAPLDTTISASVVVQEPSPDSYVWVVPADGVVGEAAVRQTDATGRTEFRWTPLEDADAATWSSTVEFGEFVSPEGDAAVIDLGADCTLERNGSTEPLIVSVDVRPDQLDDSLTGVGTYTFPNIRFESGDRVECELGNRVPVPPPTTVPESTTTVPDSSTTAPETTTTAPETTTTVPETTTTSTTTTTTTTTTSTTTSTTTTTTEAPPTDPSLGDLLAGRPELSDGDGAARPVRAAGGDRRSRSAVHAVRSRQHSHPGSPR